MHTFPGELLGFQYDKAADARANVSENFIENRNRNMASLALSYSAQAHARLKGFN